ncbi:tyrosine/serine/threonine protein phosphatase [Rhodotorula kratochvilovae]
MQLDTGFTSSLRAALDASVSPARARPPSVSLPDAQAPAPPPTLAAPPVRKSPPRLVLGAAASHGLPQLLNEAGPALMIQPASPAMSTASPLSASPTSPFPPPVPSTSSSATQSPFTPSFQPPPSPIANGGGLAARRAAKLGKKRLSLVVPTNPHSSLPSAGVNGASTLLSPVTPSFLRPSSGAHLDAETRSLPPSPVLLTTFIGAEGAEAPDRTIGRLMLKQQADEMREQMRGGRGMKRRTSIPRLNLVQGGAAAHPANLDNLASEPAPAPSGSGNSGAASAVQLIRGDAVERGGGDEAVEEFPYANGPREILPGVFLGSEQNAKDPQVLRDWRIGFVLNVAKEVDCPWGEEEEEEAVSNGLEGSQEPTPVEAPARPIVPSPPRGGAPKHRRTKTQAAIATPSPVATVPPSGAATLQQPVRPPFMRPTASTPNLHAAFQPPSPPAPPVPAIPASFLPSPPDSDPMHRSLSSSPPQARRLPSRPAPRRSAGSGGATTTGCAGAMRIAPHTRTGRPPLEYLWLKWGHDEADLVEAQKFQAAFAFLDEARERGERVLVHCQCGVSRSATVVIAYCMREAARALEEGRDAEELAGCTGMHDTYSFVKEKSEWVGPNLSLVFQLVAYERTLRGDSLDGGEGDEPPYPHYPPEPSSAHPLGDDDDLPPPTPAEGFRPFAFPPARPSASFNPLPSPRTPVSSVGSVADSQLSTPDLHDPLGSPTESTGTKASSVTSTPLSTVERLGLPPHPVRIVRPDEDEEDASAAGARDRHSSLETVVDAAEAEAGKSAKGVFVLPVPPRSSYGALLEEAVSPTVALYPPGAQQQQQPVAQQPNGFAHFAHPPPRSSLLRAAPPLTLNSLNPPGARAPSPITTTSPASAAPCSPTAAKRASLHPLQLSPAPGASSPLSPASTLSAASPATLVSALSSGSASSSSLSRTNSGRRFGAGQTLSERRASHRRVCSDTIRVPAAGLVMSTAPMGTGVGASPPRASRAEGEEP